MDEQEHRGGGGDARAAIFTRQVIAEELGEADAAQDVVEDGQGGDALRVEGVCSSVRGFPGRSSVEWFVHAWSPWGRSRRAGRYPWWGACPTAMDVRPVAVAVAMMVWRGKTSRGRKIFCFTKQHMP